VLAHHPSSVFLHASPFQARSKDALAANKERKRHALSKRFNSLKSGAFDRSLRSTSLPSSAVAHLNAALPNSQSTDVSGRLQRRAAHLIRTVHGCRRHSKSRSPVCPVGSRTNNGRTGLFVQEEKGSSTTCDTAPAYFSRNIAELARAFLGKYNSKGRGQSEITAASRRLARAGQHVSLPLGVTARCNIGAMRSTTYDEKTTFDDYDFRT
jgi:hypothetical protein